MKIELVKVKDDKQFGDGERAIMVDGVRWGRTRVARHGVHGTSHTFEQEGGETIIADPEAKYPSNVTVRSERRRWSNDPQPAPTLDRVLVMAMQLVDNGKLRHPDVVKAEQQARREAFAKRVAKQEAKEKAEMRDHARLAVVAIFEPLAIENYDSDHETAAIAAVLKAMEWAQQR